MSNSYRGCILTVRWLAGQFNGEVVGTPDGDTTNRPERIPLHGIDCPEKGQA